MMQALHMAECVSSGRTGREKESSRNGELVEREARLASASRRKMHSGGGVDRRCPYSFCDITTNFTLHVRLNASFRWNVVGLRGCSINAQNRWEKKIFNRSWKMLIFQSTNSSKGYFYRELLQMHTSGFYLYGVIKTIHHFPSFQLFLHHFILPGYDKKTCIIKHV